MQTLMNPDLQMELWMMTPQFLGALEQSSANILTVLMVTNVPGILVRLFLARKSD